jgi:hypothetical protein
LLEGRERGLPEDLVDPGAADAGDVALVAEQRVQVAGLVDRRGEGLERRAGQASGPSVATASSPRRHRRAAASPRRAAWCRTRAGAARARRRAAPAPARRGPFERGALLEDAQPPADIRWISRRQIAELDHGHLADATDRRDLAPDQLSSGGSKVFITFIPGASADFHRAPVSAASSLQR